MDKTTWSLILREQKREEEERRREEVEEEEEEEEEEEKRYGNYLCMDHYGFIWRVWILWTFV